MNKSAKLPRTRASAKLEDGVTKDPASSEGKSGKRSRAPRKRKPQQRGIEIRAEIVQSALELFSERGFEGTSTRAVAERIGISHSRLLYHFKSKEELWKATLDSALSQFFSVVGRRLSDETLSAEARLKMFIEQFVRLSADVPQIHRIMTMEGSQDTERLRWLVDNFLKEHFMRMKALIMACQERGLVREGDPARLYYFIIGAGGTAYNLSNEYRALTGRDVFSEQEILRNIALLYDLIFV